jgi:MFS family permease
MKPSSPAVLPRTSSTAWLIVALLIPVALLNYLDRQMLAAMKFSVMSEVTGIKTESDWGTVLALFKWVYAFLSPIGGYIADRYSRKMVISLSLFVWSLVTWLTGQVVTYDQLLATRALMGISEAFYIPAALALISDFHLGGTRSRAIGLHQMGIYAGVIAGGFTGYIAESPDLGWRWAFGLCGWIGIVYAVPLFFLLKNPTRTDAESIAAKVSPGEVLRALMSNPSFILLVLYFTLPALAAWVVRDWGPSILKKEFKIGQGVAGVSATLYWQLAAIGGAILGGWLADRWMKRTRRGRIYVSAIGMALIVPAMFGVGFSPSTGQLSVAIGFLILFGIGWGFFDCNNMPILCQIARPQYRASGYGIMNMVSISCGGLADWGFGKLQDLKVPLFLIFSLFASVAILSIVLVLMIQPKEMDAESTNS